MPGFNLKPEEVKVAQEGPKPIYVMLDPEQAKAIDGFAAQDGFKVNAETDRGKANQMGSIRRKYVELALGMAIEARTSK